MRRLLEEFAEIRFAAASLAFSTLLSLIPFLVVVLAAFQSIGGLDQYYSEVESILFSYFKETTGNTVSVFIRNLLTQVQAKPLGLTGILFLVVTSVGLFRRIDLVFHRLWKIQIRESLIKRVWLYSAIFSLILVILALYVGLRSTDPIKVLLTGIKSNDMIPLGLTFFLLIIYKWLPDTKVSWIAASLSAVSAGILLSVVQGSFLWFALQIFRKNKIYGSLISFPIFLLWLFIVWCIVLMGVSFCAFLQKGYPLTFLYTARKKSERTKK